MGINLFDTAPVYGEGLSEECLGTALRRRRDQALIATKVGATLSRRPLDQGVSRAKIMRAVEASLKKLQTDYIDLYQIHFPDPDTPIEETLRALDDLIRAGKVRYIGSSNFAGWQIADAEWTSRTLGLNRFVAAQNRYNLLDRDAEREVMPACRHYGIGQIPWLALAGGLLTGKYGRDGSGPSGSRFSDSPAPGHPPERLAAKSKFLNEANFVKLDGLEKFAADCGVTVLHVALSGLLALPGVSSVIAGAGSVDQVVANVAAVSWVPNADQIAALNRIVPPPDG